MGNGIGHDLKMVLDGGNGEVLNEYYQSDLNTYQSGRVVFPMSGIDAGVHQMELKAWDVHNNSATAVLDFRGCRGIGSVFRGARELPQSHEWRGYHV